MAYQCVANEDMKTLTTKNFAIVMEVSKKFITDYLLKSLSNDEGHTLVGSSLDIFNIFLLLQKIVTLYRARKKLFVMKCVQWIISWPSKTIRLQVRPCQQIPQVVKRQSIAFKMSVNFQESGVDFVKCV